MGQTNQLEIEKQQRHAVYVQLHFDLLKARDKLNIPAFKSNSDAVQVAMKLNQLMEHVNQLIQRR